MAAGLGAIVPKVFSAVTNFAKSDAGRDLISKAAGAAVSSASDALSRRGGAAGQADGQPAGPSTNPVSARREFGHALQKHLIKQLGSKTSGRPGGSTGSTSSSTSALRDRVVDWTAGVGSEHGSSGHPAEVAPAAGHAPAQSPAGHMEAQSPADHTRVQAFPQHHNAGRLHDRSAGASTVDQDEEERYMQEREEDEARQRGESPNLAPGAGRASGARAVGGHVNTEGMEPEQADQARSTAFQATENNLSNQRIDLGMNSIRRANDRQRAVGHVG